MTTDAKTRFTGSNHRSGGSATFALLLSLTSLAAVLLALTAAPALAAGSALTAPATKVHRTTAVLNGHLDPEGDPGIVECKFEWGTTVAYGNTAPCAEGNSFGAPADVSATLGGLSAATAYHFRLDIETTSNGPFSGADQSFTTRLAPSEHPLIASFGKEGTSASSFGAGVSPAMNQATRKLYVDEGGNNSGTLYGFNASAPPAFPPLGEFPPLSIRANGSVVGVPIAVDNTGLGSAGNIYFATLEAGGNFKPNFLELNGVDSSGATLPGFPIDPRVNPGPPFYDDPGGNFPIRGVAVSSAGEIWMSTNDKSRILKYSSAGAFLGSLDLPAEVTGPQLAFESNGDLYVAAEQQPEILKLTAASGYTSASKLPPAPAEVTGLAVDPSTHYLYADTTNQQTPPTAPAVAVYAPNGELFDEFGSGERRVAVDPANHDVYVGAFQKLNVYGTGAALSPPTASTAPAGAIKATTATLNGLVDPEGLAVSECKFEYGTGLSYGKTAPCAANPGSGSGDVAVSANIAGLTQNTTYYFRIVAANASASAKGVQYETFTTHPQPTVSSPSIANLTFNSTDLKALVNPRGYATTYRFEYGTTTAYGTKLPVPDANAGSGSSDVPVSVHIPGLSPDMVYHWRIVAENENGTATLPDQSFRSFGPAKAETTGSPIRTATTAQLQGRIDPDGAPTSFHFEYGTEGPCDANPCTAGPTRSAGSGGPFEFVSEPLEGLKPNTTYHYRVIAESATPPGSPSAGQDMTVTTRASDAPLSHGHFPGPPGSDRAYEQVSLPDSGGNPVGWAFAVSDDGDRAFYRVSGGTPISQTGTLLTMLFAQRTATGWRSEDIGPPRDQLRGGLWTEPAGRSDLSDQIAFNLDSVSGTGAIWRLRPGRPPAKIFPLEDTTERPAIVSEDASRVLLSGVGSLDPTHPVPGALRNLYDVTSGAPHLIGLLPDGSLPACSLVISGFELAPRASSILSADGSLAFFEACGNLYMREIDAEQTKLIGPGGFAKWTPGAVFFGTAQSLDPADTGGSDIYRYDIGDEALKCVTCVANGLDADVGGVAIADDGSRLYFKSATALLPGAATPAIYRVDVASGDLAYVAPLGPGDSPFAGSRGGDAITPDGSALVFASADPGLNALGGPQNGGTLQYYRYDDRDRSLTCLSCPQDGSPPRTAVRLILTSSVEEAGANTTALSADGQTFAFATTNPLLPADQNSTPPGQAPGAGSDIYEWRDGRLFLVTDGLTDWPTSGGTSMLEVSAITPSGHDIFFTAPARLTPDALDGYNRLYDARIGGGFDFPTPPPPCPLEVCQGTPKGAPEEPAPGTSTFRGPGNEPEPTKCPKGKVRRGGASKQSKSGSSAQRAKTKHLIKHGKCVTKHPKAKKHHKRGHRAGGNNPGAGR